MYSGDKYGMPSFRGVVKTALLLEGEGNGVWEDPMRTSYLEVHTHVGSNGLSNAPAVMESLSLTNTAGKTLSLAY